MKSLDFRGGSAGRRLARSAAATVALLFALAIPGPACAADSAAIPDPTSAEMQWVKLPAGVTMLGDIGTYRAAYRRYGEPPVDMPPSWSGQFTDDSGIAFYPEPHDGRPALLLHCPWRGGTGSAFVEYRLELPQAGPIALDFAIAMRPDAVGKSDGVTFSASLASDGPAKELMREHYTAAEPKAFHFDLAPYAGKRVTLRIQAEPGPQKNASFDFAHFVEPRITVGAAGDARAALIAAMTGAKAYKLLADADLKTMANRGDVGIVPSMKLGGKNTVRRLPEGIVLAYDGPDGRIVYQYAPKTGTLDDLLARVDESKPFKPCAGGGVTLAAGTRVVEKQQAELVSCDVVGDIVVATWKYTRAPFEAKVTWKFRIAGKALVIEAESADASVTRFSLGRPLADFRRPVPMPYLYSAHPSYLPAQNVFVMAYVDWTKSHASQSPGTESVYTAKTDGRRNALAEAGYVAVSTDLDEVLPNLPHPPSPYLKLLGPKMMVDIWGGTFEEGARMLEDYKRHGIDEVAIIYHNWQRYGYDVKLPDHLPANPQLGGDEKMKLLADTARRLGYVFSLHENYIDFYPDAPSWNPADIVLTPKGEMSKAWYQPGTKVQSFAIKAGRMLHYAEQNSPEIHRRFGTTAGYLDVHTCVPPWHQVDYDAAQEMAGMYAAKVKVHADLFAYERRVHEGPLFGEGHNHFYWAGLMDGVEAQVDGGEDCPVLVDFDLLKLHPQMANHGMGYYDRWLRERRTARRSGHWPTPEQLDKYRAQELAYGHVSFAGAGLQDKLPAVLREYNLCQPVHALYGAAKVAAIRYEVGGSRVSSSVAAATGVLDRLEVRYDSGLAFHVNLGETDWKVGDYVLPPYGFVAEGPQTLVYTARRDGVIADYARTADSLYADARTDIYKPWATGVKKIEPRVKSFKDLGGGKFEITYEWRVDDTLADDLMPFVHFCKTPADDAEGIVFQNDHAAPSPTSQWKPGTVVADGPYTIRVPSGDAAATYDIFIGLHGKGGRANLEGVSAGSNRILIGRLKVTRSGGQVEKIAMAGIDDARAEQAEGRKAFLERMNTAGKKVDFGPAATDGAFKVLVRKDGLELLPFPRDRKFQVELALGPLTGRSGIAKAAVVAVDDGGKELGSVPAQVAGDRLKFDTSISGAARYLIKF